MVSDPYSSVVNGGKTLPFGGGIVTSAASKFPQIEGFTGPMARQFIYFMQGLTKSYPTRKVLDNIHLSFYPDAKIGVLGVNGSGKSTLLKIMAGLDKEYNGEAWVAQGARVGYLEQEPHLDPTLSARENVMLGVAKQKAILDRYNELAMNYSEETADEMTKLQDEIPEALGLDLVLQLGHLVGGLFRVVHRQLVVAIENSLLLGDAEHDVLAHGQSGVELRFLFEIADARALRDPGLAGVFLVEAGHDLEQRRLTGAVDTEHAYLGVRVKRQMDIIQHLAGRIGLGQTLHEVDELASHRDP